MVSPWGVESMAGGNNRFVRRGNFPNRRAGGISSLVILVGSFVYSKNHSSKFCEIFPR